VTTDGDDAPDRARHPSAFRAARVEFAHPSERLFATLLDLYQVRWCYEPFEFPLAWDREGRPTRAFRPDFYLPDHSLLVELTVADQRLVTRKNAKVRRMRELYPELNVAIVYQRDLATLLERHGLEGLLTTAA
jgi:hypoxanthine phosphoribosyltransferase